MQCSLLAVYSALSPRHPAAVPAERYRQLIKNAIADRTADRPFSIHLAAPAMSMLSKYVEQDAASHAASVQFALAVLVGKGMWLGVVWSMCLRLWCCLLCASEPWSPCML
jgi:hypothetical protein